MGFMFSRRRRPTACAALITVALCTTGATSAAASVVLDSPPPVASDAFARVVPKGWGKADIGGSYSYSYLGTRSPFSVGGSHGVVTVAHGQRAEAILAGAGTTSVDASVTFALAALPSHGHLDASLALRGSPARSAPTEYRAAASVTHDGRVMLVWRKSVDGTVTRIAQARTRVTLAPRRAYVLRARSTGTDPTTLEVKLWPRATPEPPRWTLTATDSDPHLQRAGAVGVRVAQSSRRARTDSVRVNRLFASPVVVPDGTVLWRADGEQPAADEWAEYSTDTNCAVTSDTVAGDPAAYRVQTPVAQGSYAYGFTIHDGDACYGERAELGQALPTRAGFTESRLFNQGDDRWISFQVYLGSDFPVGTGDWNVIAQWKQLVSTSPVPVPMIALQVHDGAFYLEHAAGTASAEARTTPTRLATATTGRWVKMSFHIHFSTDPTVGFVQIYGDPDGTGTRELTPLLHFSTLATDANGNAVPSHSRIGIYRNPNINGTAHLYYDGYTVATSEYAAEAVAFP